MTPQYSLTIVLPTYNEYVNIGIFISDIQAAFSGVNFEILVVDDNSTDGTPGRARALNDTYGNIRVLGRPGKMGIGSALHDGYDAALGEYVLSSDCDLSFLASDLRRLYDHCALKGKDLVLGCRYSLPGSKYEVKGFSAACKRQLSATGNTFLRIFSGIPVHDFSANCRCIRKESWRSLEVEERGNIMLFETIVKARYHKLRIDELPVAFLMRKHGYSKLRISAEVGRYLLRAVRYIVKYAWHRERSSG